MRGNAIKKMLVAMIFIAPIIIYSDCKKQAKCGCGKDVLFSLAATSCNIYFTDGSTISAQTVGDIYSTYIFCNPSEMFKNLANSKTGDVLQVTGSVYWDCNYVYQTSNSTYQSLYKTYDIQVTGLTVDLYGKNKPGTGTDMNSVTPQN
ncbi:MAG: hypothetical protein WA816_10035 [Bacteroidales bacterium]